MTISEFAERYNLHDSFIEHAEYDEQRRKVILRTTVNGEHTFEMVLLDEATDEIYEMRIAADDIDAVVDIP